MDDAEHTLILDALPFVKKKTKKKNKEYRQKKVGIWHDAFQFCAISRNPSPLTWSDMHLTLQLLQGVYVGLYVNHGTRVE